MKWIYQTILVIGIVLNTTAGSPFFEKLFLRSNPACQSLLELRVMVGECLPELWNTFSEVAVDNVATGPELLTLLSTTCSRIPAVRECAASVVDVCPELDSFLLDPLDTDYSRNCDGSTPATWLKNALENYVFDMTCLRRQQMQTLLSRCFIGNVPEGYESPDISFVEKARLIQSYTDNIFYCIENTIPTLFDPEDNCSDPRLYILFAYTMFADGTKPSDWMSPSDTAFAFVQNIAESGSK